MSSFNDHQFAAQFRDTIERIATGVVNRQSVSIRIGKVFSYDAASQTAKILFAGETIDNLVKVSVGANMVPNTQMSDTFADKGYDADGDIVRVMGKPGSYFVVDYRSGDPTKRINDAVDAAAGAADEANTKAFDAHQLATDALAAANEAADFAQAAINVYYQATKPTTGKDGDIWYDTDDGNRQYVYEGTDFVDARDTGIAAALNAAAAAGSSADAANSSINGWTFSGTTDINGGKIHTDSVTASQIDANAITAKHTITGALFQTTDTAARGIKFGSAGLTAWNSSGTPTFTLDASNGNLTMMGSLTTGSSITGAVVTGGVVQTTTTASRGIKLNTSYFIAYNSSGATTFSIDANTGNVVMLGTLTSGSSITGATITGTTLSTSTSGERIAIGLVDETYLPSLSSVAFFGPSPYDNYPGAIRAVGTSTSTTSSALMIYPPSRNSSNSYRPRLNLWDDPSSPGAALRADFGDVSIAGTTVNVYGSTSLNGATAAKSSFSVTVGSFTGLSSNSSSSFIRDPQGSPSVVAGSGSITVNGGNFLMPSTPVATVGSTAGFNTTATTQLIRSSSGLKYKIDVHRLADAPQAMGSSILAIDAIRYRDRYIDDMRHTQGDVGEARFWIGWLAEQFIEAGWNDLVIRDHETGEPDGLMYDRILPAVLMEIRARFEAIEARLNA